MARAAKLGRIVAVHAESDQLTGLLARRAIAQGRVGARDYLASRPVVAELEAIDASDGDLDRYHLFHAARADLLRQLGRRQESRHAYERALTLAQQGPERRFLLRRLAQL